MKSVAYLTALTLCLVSNCTAARIAFAANTHASGQKTTGADNSRQELLKVHVEQNVFLGNKHLSAHKFTDAESSYRKALAEDPNNLQARAGLGMALAKQFKLDGAAEQFEKVLAQDPNNAMAHAGKALTMLHRLQSSSGTIIAGAAKTLETAEQEANQAIAQDPNLPEPHFVLANIMKERGHLDGAAKEYEIATHIDPQYAEAHAGLGLTKLMRGEVAAAVEDFTRAIGHDSSNSTAHFGLGTAYLKLGRTDEAITELQTSLYQYPNSAPVRYMLGEAYRSQGNNLAAIREYQESIRIKPENPAAYMHIADLRESRGDLEHAIAELRSAREVMPDDLNIRKRLADMNLKLEKLDAAIEDYKAVLAARPDDAQTKAGLVSAYNMKAQKEVAKSFFTSNGYDQAQSALSEAVRLSPNDMELRLAQTKLRKLAGQLFKDDEIKPPQNDGEVIAYSEALIHRHEFKEALEQMNKLILKTNDAKQLLAIGDTALMIHDLEAAEGAYRKAVNMPDAKDRAERGLVQVAKIRDDARKDLALGSDLALKKQYSGAIDKFYEAIKKDPRDPVARHGLAKVLERVEEPTVEEVRESVKHWRAYMSLEPALPQSERNRIEHHVARLENAIAKAERRSQTANAKNADKL